MGIVDRHLWIAMVDFIIQVSENGIFHLTCATLA
jgi:hypothetical protein